MPLIPKAGQYCTGKEGEDLGGVGGSGAVLSEEMVAAGAKDDLVVNVRHVHHEEDLVPEVVLQCNPV
jgi:hypothetical protein